jgi:hypothetical protein
LPDNLRNQAEVLAVALEIGAASVSDAVAWADAVIAAEEHPQGDTPLVSFVHRSS